MINFYRIFGWVVLFSCSLWHSAIGQATAAATDTVSFNDTLSVTTPADSASIPLPTDTLPVYRYTIFAQTPPTQIVLLDSITLRQRADSLVRHRTISRNEFLLYASNPLTLPLVYMGKDIHAVWNGKADIFRHFYPQSQQLFCLTDKTKDLSAESLVAALRNDARTNIANSSVGLYTTTLDRLPHLSSFMSRSLQHRPLEQLNIYEDKIMLNSNRIEYEGVKPIYWIKRANAMLQFTQNYVSPDWHQGGQSSLAFLGTFIAEFNYDNRKNVQWDNKIEWRSGFSSVDGDTLRKISTNDDILRYLTKLGRKASGNWYYSVSGDFSTTLFDSYKGINSKTLKARLLTPVRVTIGVGLDFKYKKMFSLMIAPVSFKYIYLNDTAHVSPNAFGIKKGENQLKQIGSSLLAQLNYSPMPNWNITSKLTFYTDYKKIEADWEIVNNFTINRFLSARLLVNPRYDNTAILKRGQKTYVQLKELLSLGFSYRFF